MEETIRKFGNNCHNSLPNFLELRRGGFTTRNNEAEVFRISLAVLVVLDLVVKKFSETDFELGELVWLRNTSQLPRLS